MVNKKNKRGVSDVITTVLIILLVLAAVAIIGGILLRNIGDAGSKIETSTGCIELDLQPVSCSGIVSATSAGVGAGVLVQRGSRGSNLQISKINAVVEKGDGTTASGSISVIPAALATANIDVVNIGSPRKSATVSATLQGADGSQQTCELSNVKVDCGLGSGASVNLDSTGSRPSGAAGNFLTAGIGYSVGAKIVVPCTTTNAVLKVTSVDVNGGITNSVTETPGVGCTPRAYYF